MKNTLKIILQLTALIVAGCSSMKDTGLTVEQTKEQLLERYRKDFGNNWRDWEEDVVIKFKKEMEMVESVEGK